MTALWSVSSATLPGPPGFHLHREGFEPRVVVFDADGVFVTAEIATFMASADDRASPDDSNVNNTDGTYWPFVPGLYVCHHQSD